MSGTLLSLALITAAVSVLSLVFSPRAKNVGSFYHGADGQGEAPGLLTLTFSQVTTWIFARSIMNAAVLGYFYGIGGALAYAAYYLSFLTGARIVASLRFRHGYSSVSAFLSDRFGASGAASYHFVVGVRLLSEVFANLLVIGLIFGTDGSVAYVAAIVLVGVVTFGYAVLGGLHASLRTDVLQMALFLVALIILMAIATYGGGIGGALGMSFRADIGDPGWVLLAVAFLQVWSYPLHDPVMMDRGFIADKKTTMASFYHAAWISVLCILAFGALGVWAGVNKLEGESMIPTLTRLLGDWPMVLFNAALVISCMSTLDSTFSSAAKLSVVDAKLGKPSVANGRIAMFAFLVGGLAMVFFGSKDLFAAVAVSGTASMFLAPVVFFCLWGGRDDVPLWSYLTSFFAAMVAAGLYFTESSGYTNIIGPIAGVEHKYSKLLILCIGTLVIGCSAFALGIIGQKPRERVAGGA